ncbi:hypothetical protein Aasi_0523 [Candidatus Amoebophilus asiaticus 5a2]|uniref:Leucine-binding protein domain-containing protein n=1 Tax=Amoebophilus asiaticus (strain 5a2) TaxID=452471 RepID=B3ERS4_AMOA5|nr:ABC transporter substrate-binding protein [Candidatus Amoebophilus asiaticus]ACE05926.1 hypothetical protein Aasi_0523 [Candidatus Amoebophilus asiaticus 5a2]
MFKKLFYTKSVFLLLTLSAYSYAVDAATYQLETYKHAKKYYKKGDHQACQKLLTPLLESPLETSIIPYAYFFYALSAYRQSMPEVAELTFNKLIQYYSNWSQRNEVLYWLAQLRFEQKDYITAFYYLKQIKDNSLDTAIGRMKDYFLAQTEDVNLLDILLRHYPTDITVAKAWLYRQSQLPFMKQDGKHIEEVAQRLDLTNQLYDPLRELTSIKKASYHVAVLLPFFINEVNYEEKTSNQFVLDLYKGIQAATEKLYQEGIHIILHAYDTQKSATVTAHLLDQEEMKYMDLIIGPLYANTIPLVSEFARKYGINVFNPLSVNSYAVGNNPFVYLLKPSLETQAKQAAYFTQQYADLSQAQIGIIYGTAPEDLLKASIYKEYMEEYIGKEIDLILEFQPQTSQQFLSMFRGASNNVQIKTADQAVQLNKCVLDNLTHIYIASQDELIIANILSAIQIRKLKPHIIGDEAWLKKSSVTLDQLQRLKISFLAPDYIDYNRESLHTFRQDYYNQFGVFPNYYAEVGYDMMSFLGNMLSQHGIYFQKHWGLETFEGQIFSGFSYGKHHDNQHIPIIKFEKSKFIVCN